MLVLSRGPKGRINIHCQCGCSSSVTVERVTGNKVALGFEAPKETRILRSEIDKPTQWPLPGSEKSDGR